jgi:hypothetical protein
LTLGSAQVGQQAGWGAGFNKGRLKMADMVCISDYEKSEKICVLLMKSKQLCEVPGCNQPKTYRKDSRFCFCHDKEKKKPVRY